MSRHTPGRMIVESCTNSIGYYVASDQIEYDAVCDCTDLDNARRICAAWNACDGISTEALKAGVVKDMLEALKMVAWLDQGFVNDGKRAMPSPQSVIEAVLAAIARATGEKP